MKESTRPTLACALYSEDGSKQSEDTLRAVILGMCKHLEEGTKTQPKHLSFSTIGRGITGSSWKSYGSRQRGAQEQYRTLIRAVATELKRSRVVFFHVDGDSKWSEQRTASVWKSLQRFRRDLQAITQFPEHDFLEVVPFYSMESWLFANIRLLRTRVRTAEEHRYLDRWADDLAQLDEELKIKECLPSVRNHYNSQLAAGIPCAQLKSVKTSYDDTLKRMRNSVRLIEGLRDSRSRPY